MIFGGTSADLCPDFEATGAFLMESKDNGTEVPG